MVDVLVGAPSWRREWILYDWACAAKQSADEASAKVSFLLELDTSDQISHELMQATAETLGCDYSVIWTNEDPLQRRDRRDWGVHRYEQMTHLRNNLLKTVRLHHPSYFLSLDTDIILHPDAIGNLLESVNGFDAVGAKCFMSPAGNQYPSWGQVMNGAALVRSDSELVMPVEVIMAAKLMSPKAYGIDYVTHELGEDIGWSLACRKAGIRLGWDGRVTSKHVMHADMLITGDPRCGF